MITPQNDNFQFTQTYQALFIQGPIAADVALAASNNATNPGTDFPYKAGVIMAVYTGGPNVGLYVNYDAAGANGQQTPVGVLTDQNVPYTTDAVASATITFANAGFQVAGLTSCSSDVATAMVAIGGKLIPNSGSGNFYWVP
jgi:hypothetical protein